MLSRNQIKAIIFDLDDSLSTSTVMAYIGTVRQVWRR